ncbi:chemotaxis protein CheW, partial [Massilia sp. DD77]|uniref:chemotaxis protein CheW n=1 Tax=Massilia sp. DD77 TaxID=3109349 RepID=UPI002FFE9E98
RQAVLRERRALLARLPAQSEAGEPGDALEVLGFEVAGERYAIETRWVAQALALPPLTQLPGVPAHVAGIAAFRGRVVAALDLRLLLQVPLARLTEPSALVVLQGAGMEFGLLADTVLGVERYGRAALSPGVSGGAATRRGYLLGVSPDRTALLDGARLLGDPALVVGAQARSRMNEEETP